VTYLSTLIAARKHADVFSYILRTNFHSGVTMVTASDHVETNVSSSPDIDKAPTNSFVLWFGFLSSFANARRTATFPMMARISVVHRRNARNVCRGVT
ncbi:hypothetical protein LSAT2_011898, partial [Lamellibrachia satsuma]